MKAENVAVLGGGLMGAAIAQVFAAAGHAVQMFEPNAEVRAALPERIRDSLRMVGGDAAVADRVGITGDLAQAVAQAAYVTEAVPERLELKRQVFADLERFAPAEAILASNSSVIPITEIAAGLATAQRMVGTHWWNPAHLIPLVEVIQGAQTSRSTIAATMDILRRIGKQPAHVKRDVPGFVGNRLQHALWREAIAMVAEGICDAETLDTCVKTSFGLRLPVLGPLENADLVGLELTLDIHRTIIPALDRHEGPHEILSELIAAGRKGFSTGAGFRDWTPEQIAQTRKRLVAYLVQAQTRPA